ncbi:MAG: hypothetical protein EHM83_02310 [Burkholderiales bacterium]|nr:MAG: hypothetical protein EHM83_02310 [Burkholderiales bacterium]
MSLEDIWYESSPYVYLLSGVATLVGSEGVLGTASALLLLIAAATILRLRWSHRQRGAAARARANRIRDARARLQAKPVTSSPESTRRAGSAR